MRGKTRVTIVLITILILLAAAGVLIARLVDYLAPSKERIALQDYISAAPGELLTIQNDALATQNARLKDGAVYLSLALVQELNERFFFEEEMRHLIFTTGTELFRIPQGEKKYYCNEKRIDTEHVVLLHTDGELFLLLDFAKDYLDLKFQRFTNPDRIVLRYHWGDFLCADVVKETQMRTEPSKDSPIVLDLAVGTKLQYFNSGGLQENGYVMVMSEDGIFGYVRMKNIGASYYKSIQSEYTEPVYSTKKRADSVNLSWHLTVSARANAELDALFAGTEGLNVISPTWFDVKNESGMLNSRAELSYVERAHELGLEVWGLVSNSHPDSAELVEIDELALLRNYNSRTNLIRQIMLNAKEYRLDGVNIDFESLSAETGPYYLQFLRELSVNCRNSGLVLSVDNYVPTNYNAFYDLEEQGRYVDYVVIMAYDEHYYGSDAGSTASLGFVRDAASNTLALVPAERVIMAVPFYTRLWQEVQQRDGSMALTSQTVGIVAADALLRENKVSTTWQAENGQFYGEYEKGGTRYRIWVEDEMSIEEKMKVIKTSGFAGVASWRLGLERRATWEIMKKYLH